MTDSPGPILQLLVSTKPGGGLQHVFMLARGLRARGWEPVVAGPADGALFDAFGEAGSETVALATNRLTPAMLVRLVGFVRRRGIRLIHSHGKGAGLYGRLAARYAGIPAVHTFHGIHFERYSPLARATYLALDRLERLAAERSLGSRAVFPGEVVAPSRVLPAFDMFATASRKEGMPLAVLEAMALGLPVVASDIPAHREVLPPDCGGLVPGTVDGFATALGRLARDAETRAPLGAQNRTRARSEFAARQMIAALAAIYGEVLDV